MLEDGRSPFFLFLLLLYIRLLFALQLIFLFIQMNFIEQATGMHQDPILGRMIAFAPSERTEDDDELSDFERLVDELILDRSQSEHTRWQSDVKDQPLRRSARSTETNVTAEVSIFSSFSSFLRTKRPSSPKSHNNPSTPPRKPIRAKSRSKVGVGRPQLPRRTASYESDKSCPILRKSLSCSIISLLKT